MTTREPRDRSGSSFDGSAARGAKAALKGALFLVLMTTLFPYEFYLPAMSGDSPGSFSFFLLSAPDGWDDLVGIGMNLMLFFPVGFAFSPFMVNRGWSRPVALGRVLVAGFGFSLLLEILQIFLPARHSSLFDMARNSMGILLGFLCFRLWGEKWLTYLSSFVDKGRRLLSSRNSTLFYVAYVCLVLVVSIALERWIHLRNWDESYPLILGPLVLDLRCGTVLLREPCRPLSHRRHQRHRSDLRYMLPAPSTRTRLRALQR